MPLPAARQRESEAGALILDLRGTVAVGPRGPLPWLDALAVWLAAWAPGRLRGVVHDGGAGLHARLHPCAPGVAISLEPLQKARGRSRGNAHIRLVARTEAPGPGYHAFLVGLAHALAGEQGVRWEVEKCRDDTGLFLGEGEACLQRRYDATLAVRAASALARLGAGETEVGLNLPSGLAFPLPDAVATPLGPRGEAWLRAVAEDGAAGRDVYPWRDLEAGPEEALGRALCVLWLEARPHPPLSEAETATWLELAELLKPQLLRSPVPDLPWRAFADALAYTGEGGLLAARVRGQITAETPEIGYRRGPVRVSLPDGWSVEVPGSFADDLEEGGTWVAWDETHTLWVSVLAPQEANAGAAPLLGAVEGVGVIAASGPGWVGRAELQAVEEAPEADADAPPVRYLRLSGRAAAPDSLVVFTLCFSEEAARDGALRIWGSLRRG